MWSKWIHCLFQNQLQNHLRLSVNHHPQPQSHRHLHHHPDVNLRSKIFTFLYDNDNVYHHFAEQILEMLSHLNINQKYLYSLEKREGGNSCFILPLLLRNVIKFSFLIAVSLLHTLCLKNDERSTVKCQFHQNCENISMRNKIMKVAGSHDYYQRHIGFTEHLIRPLFFWLTLTSVTYYIITSSHHGQTWTYDWSHSTDSDNQPLILSHSCIWTKWNWSLLLLKVHRRTIIQWQMLQYFFQNSYSMWNYNDAPYVLLVSKQRLDGQELIIFG